MSNVELNVKLTWLKKDGTPGNKICSLVVPEGADNKELSVIKSIGQMLFASDSPLEEMVDGEKIIKDVKVIAHGDNNYDLQLKSQVMRLRVQLKANLTKPEYQYVCEVESPALQSNYHLTTNFAYLFNSKLYSDIRICIGDKSIYAHKVIVVNKSAFFNGFFFHGGDEPTTNFVRIINAEFDYETMYDLLFYIYNGTTYSRDDNSNQMFQKYCNLLKADKEFVVDGLQEICELKLSSILTIANVVDCLILADSCNAVYLKWQAISYVVENSDQVIQVLTNEKFISLHPQVFDTIVRALVEKKKNPAKL